MSGDNDRSYLQHGGRHGLFGSDLTPNSALAYIIARSSIMSISDNTQTSVNFDPGVVAWGTDEGAGTASEFFDLQDPGSGVFELALLANALYVIDIYAEFTVSTPAPAANSIGAVGLSNTVTQIGGNGYSPWLATGGTPSYAAQPSLRAILNWPSGSLPILHGISVYQNSGGTIGGVFVNFMVQLINYSNAIG